MKPIIILVASCMTAMSAFAQTAITVNVTLNGNQNRDLLIDGRAYTANSDAAQSNTDMRGKSTYSITDLGVGSHNLQVVRTNPNTNRRTTVTQKTFNLRSGYDLDIAVNGNGTIQLTERRNRNRGRNNTSVRTPMSNSNFNIVLQDVRRQYNNTARVSALTNVFGNTSNYFTSSQISQLVGQVTGESNRLQLLKYAHRSITDVENFSRLYTLLTSSVARQELAAYANANSQNGTIPSSNTGVYGQAMTTANYNSLVAQVRAQYDANNRVNVIYNAFSNPSNYFTTQQARNLIQMITGEANMLNLAKASYRSITDKNSFSSIYNLLPTQASRNELAQYVNSYNPTVPYDGSVYNNPSSGGYRVAMSESSFANLLNQVRGQWLPGAKKTAVINAFSTGDFFTSAQAVQLIQLDNDEPDRLDMAKASYKTITDAANFSQVYNLFSTATYRDELARYVNSYSSGSGASTGSTPGYQTAMSDANFTTLLNTIRGQWLPGAKKTAVLNAFNSADYFTTAQAVQLIQLDSDEDDRLDMAKASYRKVIDPNNFSQVYNLFTTPSFREALVAYVNANR